MASPPVPSGAAPSIPAASSSAPDGPSNSSFNYIVIGAAAAAVVVTGVAVYLYTRPAMPPAKTLPKSALKKKSDRLDAGSNGSSTDTTPSIAPAAGTTSGLATANAKLTPAEKADRSKAAKNRGNKLYEQKRYKEAVEAYTEAIEYNPDDSVFYSNRAACFMNLSKLDECIQDCTAALRLNPSYVKSLYRRGTAYERKNELYQSLVDYTATCIMEEFKKDETVKTTDRVLRDLAKVKAGDIMKVKREHPELPSPVFITAYLDSFRGGYSSSTIPDPPPTPAHIHLKKAVDLVHARDYNSALVEIKETTNGDMSGLDPGLTSMAWNLLGTFKFLLAEIDGAMEAFEKSIQADKANVNSIVKFAGCYMEKGDIPKALEEFDRATETSPQDPDTFYHRGQVRFLLGNNNEALEDYEKALRLDPTFVFNQIQIAVLQYRLGQVDKALQGFEECSRRNPGSADVWNYYGEILLDMQRFDEAVSNFDKAIKIRPVSPLSYMNKAFSYIQRQDLAQAEQFCRRATEVDPKCDLAYAQWAQILMQQNKLDEALEKYEVAISLSRTEPEVVQNVMFRTAALAQRDVLQQFPQLASKLGMR
ncbi:TOM (translocase of outer membrane) complex component [Gonapodya sp. JEL0774]|nr:TOM (translocase of outer membrane) complex component [Gonapodya sp. JEL0774]